ncbi:MAG: hypothetical protein AABN34_29720, partial [Acidobacteriota bacterium]
AATRAARSTDAPGGSGEAVCNGAAAGVEASTTEALEPPDDLFFGIGLFQSSEFLLEQVLHKLLYRAITGLFGDPRGALAQRFVELDGGFGCH